ncbi:MAG TPA: YqgE/AlgH family protein [Jiangellaceae bacterium]
MSTGAQTLAGRLLVATPALRDPNFDRAVILLLSHDDDGALGVVVNRPTEVPVTDILPNWQAVVTEPGVVFQGGPVSLDSALGLVVLADGTEPLGVRRVSGRLGVVDLDAPPEVVQPGVVAMRVFAGYAGWSPDQLETEIAEGSWYVVDAETDDAFRGDAPLLWRAVLRRQPGALALMATFPADPSLN